MKLIRNEWPYGPRRLDTESYECCTVTGNAQRNYTRCSVTACVCGWRRANAPPQTNVDSQELAEIRANCGGGRQFMRAAAHCNEVENIVDDESSESDDRNSASQHPKKGSFRSDDAMRPKSESKPASNSENIDGACRRWHMHGTEIEIAYRSNDEDALDETEELAHGASVHLCQRKQEDDKRLNTQVLDSVLAVSIWQLLQANANCNSETVIM